MEIKDKKTCWIGMNYKFKSNKDYKRVIRSAFCANGISNVIFIPEVVSGGVYYQSKKNEKERIGLINIGYYTTTMTCIDCSEVNNVIINESEQIQLGKMKFINTFCKKIGIEPFKSLYTRMKKEKKLNKSNEECILALNAHQKG